MIQYKRQTDTSLSRKCALERNRLRVFSAWSWSKWMGMGTLFRTGRVCFDFIWWRETDPALRASKQISPHVYRLGESVPIWTLTGALIGVNRTNGTMQSVKLSNRTMGHAGSDTVRNWGFLISFHQWWDIGYTHRRWRCWCNRGSPNRSPWFPSAVPKENIRDYSGNERIATSAIQLEWERFEIADKWFTIIVCWMLNTYPVWIGRSGQVIFN